MFVDYDVRSDSFGGDGGDSGGGGGGGGGFGGGSGGGSGDGIVHGLPPSPGIHHSQQWIRWLTPEEQKSVSPGQHELRAEASLDVLASKVSASFRLADL
jgi:hypothetical protein